MSYILTAELYEAALKRIAELEATLETARKALEYYPNVPARHTAQEALSQIAKPCSICQTPYEPYPYQQKHIALGERAVAASDHFRDTAKMVAPDGKDDKSSALEERDRAVAKNHGPLSLSRNANREFGLEE